VASIIIYAIRSIMLYMIGDRLKQLRTEAGLSGEAFGAIAGTTKQYVSQLESGRNQTPGAEYLEKWARHFKVSMRWLLDGHGPKFVSDQESSSEDWPGIRATTQHLGLGSPTAVEEYAESHQLKFRASSLQRKKLRADRCEIAYGKGDSMLPRIHDGDAILFNRDQTTPVDGKLFVITIEGVTGQYEPQVKECLILGDTVYFQALNPAGDHNWRRPRPMQDKRHEIKILGQVRWIGSWED
jgi:transcriptional regulator with XRE-family HTH domain